MPRDAEAVFAFLSRHGLEPHANPFDAAPEVQLTLASAIVRGEVGEDWPCYPIDPTASQALIMARAVGVTPAVLRESLSLSPDVFDAWLRGHKARLTDAVLPNGVTTEGVRRLFGAFAFFIQSSSAPTRRKEHANANADAS